MSYRTALFDLDGTLIDSIDLIVASHRHATETVLGERLPDEVLRSGIGRPLRTQMERFDAAHADELYDAYRAFNHAHHDAYVRPCDGMLELLRALRLGGVATGCVTSKSIDTVRRAFALMPLEPLLDVVVTADMCLRHKPDPEPLRLALELLGRDPAGACYVGDAVADLQAARAAGVAAIAVSWGAHGSAELQDEAPAALAHTAGQLERVLRGDG
jgi:pyrophosphatase PpaX